MPKRFELIKELKDTKTQLDNKVLRDNDLANDEIMQLIKIIGKDFLFRQAEKRNKPTLRHITWKLLKSLQAFKKFYKRLDQNKIPKQFKNKVLYLTEFLNERLPYIEELLKKIDLVYRREYSILELILAGEENVNAYKDLLQQEKEIIIQIEPHFIVIKQRTITFANVLIEYEKYLKSEGKNLSAELKSLVGYFILWSAFTITGLIGVFTLFYPTKEVNTMWTLIIGGIGIGGLTALSFEVREEFKKITETMI